MVSEGALKSVGGRIHCQREWILRGCGPLDVKLLVGRENLQSESVFVPRGSGKDTWGDDIADKKAKTSDPLHTHKG